MVLLQDVCDREIHAIRARDFGVVAGDVCAFILFDIIFYSFFAVGATGKADCPSHIRGSMRCGCDAISIKRYYRSLAVIILDFSLYRYFYTLGALILNGFVALPEHLYFDCHMGIDVGSTVGTGSLG